MEVVWELTNAVGTQRKRAISACSGCKRRKKKCPHVRKLSQRQRGQPDPTNDTSERRGITRRIDHIAQEEPPSQGTAESTAICSDPSHEPIQVGDYHAESLLTELVAESPVDTATRPAIQDGREPHESSVAQLVGRRDTTTRCCAETIQRFAQRWAFDLAIEPKTWVAERHRDHGIDSHVALSLPRDTLDALVTTYISNLDAVVPVLDGSQVLREYTMGRASNHLLNAICLTACKTKQAAPHLRLSDDGLTLTPHDFAKAIYRDLEVAMRLDLEPNRVTKIQILALMWMHHDDYRGVQKASAWLSQSIQDAWVLALHFDDRNRPNSTQCRYLWWTLRALDRQNACIQGVPLMIADRDVDLSRPDLQRDSRSQVATVSYRLGDLMDEVMEIYRPFLQRRGQTVLEEFPTFFEVSNGIDLSRLQESHRDYLEIWYLVLAMLSCRYGKPGSNPYERRFRSAVRVQQLTSHGRHANLPPLPIIPYAVSLSLTVTWRALKDYPQAMGELMSEITSLQAILQELGKWSPKAAEMYNLGGKLMSSLKAPASATAVASESNTRDHQSESHSNQRIVDVRDRSRNVLSSTPGSIPDRTWDSPAIGTSSNGDLESQFMADCDTNMASTRVDETYNAISLGFEGNVDGFEALMAPGTFDFSQLDASHCGDAFGHYLNIYDTAASSGGQYDPTDLNFCTLDSS